MKIHFRYICNRTLRSPAGTAAGNIFYLVATSYLVTTR